MPNFSPIALPILLLGAVVSNVDAFAGINKQSSVMTSLQMVRFIAGTLFSFFGSAKWKKNEFARFPVKNIFINSLLRWISEYYLLDTRQVMECWSCFSFLIWKWSFSSSSVSFGKVDDGAMMISCLEGLLNEKNCFIMERSTPLSSWHACRC